MALMSEFFQVQARRNEFSIGAASQANVNYPWSGACNGVGSRGIYWSFGVLAFVKGPEKLSWNYFFFKST